MDYLENLLSLLWGLRFVITFAISMALLALWLDARLARDKARVEARRLYFANASLRSRLASKGVSSR